MKLLKYPLGITDRCLNALEAVDSHLILVDNKGHVIVWLQANIVNAAFDKIKISDLSPSFEFDISDMDLKKGAKGINDADQNLRFVMGNNESLFIGSDKKIICYKDWQITCKESTSPKYQTIFECKSSSIIADMKLDSKLNIIFVIVNNKNKIMLYNCQTLSKLSEIELDDSVKPITGVIDPSGKIFTVFSLDRSILIYQINEKGQYKLINKLPQYLQLYPMNYKISMSPQANQLPVLNSIKGATSTVTNSTLLLDRNDNYKIISTLVTPPYIKSKVLKFSPMVYDKLNVKKNTRTQYNLLATSGAVAGSIIIWNTKRIKPLFNAIKVSESPINDMTWSEDGMTLFAISNDNVLYNFAFQEYDLGDVLPPSEVELLQKQNKELPDLTEIKEGEIKFVVKSEEDSTLLNGDVPSVTQENSNNVKSFATKKKTKKKALIQSVTSSQSTTMEFNVPSYNVPKDLKRKPKEDVNGEIINKKQKKELEPMDFLDTGLLLPNASFSRIRLATPKIRLTFKYSPSNNKNLSMDIKNGSGNEQKPTILTLTSTVMEQCKILFRDFIPKFVTMCSAGDFFWSCATEDGTIYVYSDAGKRLLPPIILGIPCSFLEACSKYLLCVTSVGELYCWDIEAKKLSFPVNNVYPLLNPSLRYSDDILTRAENITMCSLTEKGIPLVTLSNGDGYMFDKDMQSWLLISDGWWAYGSQYWDMTNTAGFNDFGTAELSKNTNNSGANELMSVIKSDKKSVVNFIECKTNDELTRKGRIKNLQRFARTILMKEGFENIEEAITLSHLENRILVSLKLEEATEFKDLLIIYCIRLSELSYTDRLDDVLQWLYNNGDFESSMLAGESRKELLKDVLVACADIRHVQRVTTSYASAVGLVDQLL